MRSFWNFCDNIIFLFVKLRTDLCYSLHPTPHYHCEAIKPVISKANQPWMFIGRTDAEAEAPILWLLIEKANALEKTLMLGKIEDGRRRGRQGWNGWMASPTLRTWVWAKLWETVKDREAGVLQALGSQRARHDWVTEQQPPFILSGRRKKKKKNTSYIHQVHTPFKPHSITREKVPALSEITGSLPWKRPVMLEWERRMDFSSLQHLSLGGQELDMVHGPGCLCD